MENINKLISCSSVLAKIARTFKPSGTSWRTEAIEDIGWGIQAIGYHADCIISKMTKPPYIEVKHHRALIPCDVERIRHVEQLLPSSDAISGNILNPDGTTPTPPIDENCNYRGRKLKLGTDSTSYGLAEDNPRTTAIEPVTPYYNLQGDYIITGFAEGLLRLHYSGFALDKKGYPLIVDDFNYKTALEWYCIGGMIMKGYKHPEVSYKDIMTPNIGYFDIYRYRAENAIKLMSLDSAERFSAAWNRIFHGVDLNDNFFMHMEQQEYIDRG